MNVREVSPAKIAGTLIRIKTLRPSRGPIAWNFSSKARRAYAALLAVLLCGLIVPQASHSRSPGGSCGFLGPALPDRGRVHDAAHGPEMIQSARDAERRLDADVAVIDLGIVADVPEDAHDPILGEPDLLPVIPFGADEPLDVGLCRSERLVDGLRADARLLRVQHCEVRPFHDVEPLGVLLTDRGPERLLRDDLGQNDVVVRLGQGRALSMQLRDV